MTPNFGSMRKCIAFGLLGWLLTLNCLAQDSLVFIPQSNQPFQPLSHHLQMLEDRQGMLGSERVIGNDTLIYKPIAPSGKIDPRSTYWIKLQLQPSFSSDSFFIGLPSSQTAGINQGNDKVDIWVGSSAVGYIHYETGTLTPLSKRPVRDPVNRNLFPVQLRAGQPLVIYWRIQRTMNFEELQLNFALQHASVVHPADNFFDKTMWFYTGVMLILFIFGLVFSIITRERSFISFTCSAFLLCAHGLMLNSENNFVRLLIPESPALQFQFFTLLTAAFVLFLMQFTRAFAETRRLVPRWDKFLLGVMAALSVLVVVDILLQQFNPALSVPVFFVFMIFISFLVIGIRLMFTKNLYARLTGFAILWLFSFQILGVLWNMNLVPAWIPNPWFIAQVGMMIILFFALAYRFKQSAKEKAEAAKVIELDAIKSRFFANISHEFRTPLTLMLGPLKQMEENTLDEKQQKKYINMIRRNGDRLLQLINQLLDLSKLESGKMDLQVAKTDITGFLKAIAASFESLAEQNQVNYHIHFPEENIIGWVDRDKLEKIVVNLLSNAFRFTPVNGTVSFSVENDDKRLRFIVQDNGVGMPKEQLSKIFDRFHQVAGTEGGTGIGLSLAKELLQLHKGQVSVQSDTGKGSSFRISIPIAPEFYNPAEINSGLATQAKFSSNSSEASYIKEEIVEELVQDDSLPLVLIVEDNPDLQQYISDTLRSQFQVQIAPNGKAGMQKATELIPDCIISDVMMPEMDGIEMCGRLKKEGATSHIPIILLTAKAGSGSRIEGLQTGADDYLIKPFDGAELVVRVQNLVEQRKQLRERYSREVISIQPDLVELPSLEHSFIQQVRNIIEENIDNELFGVSELADSIHLSRSQLHRKLKSLTGQAPNELIRHYRLERAMQFLQQNSGTIAEISYQTGFSSPAYFSKCFSDRYGYPPGDMKKKV
jgi:signal transduction histidine kinase/DNA-binding response OmpR family regulator